jgi:hypothetical protein
MEAMLMAAFCDYVLSVSETYGLKTVKDYRAFAEKVASHFGRRLIRFSAGARAGKKLFFGSSKVRQYSAAKQTYFDEVKIADLARFGFSATNIKRSAEANLFLDFNFHCDSSRPYIQLVLDSAEDKDVQRFDQTKRFLEILKEVSNVEFALADKMESEKWVPMFASGTGLANGRNDFENSVAYSISLSQYLHHTPPFLFAYNYIKMDTSLLEPVPEQTIVKKDADYVTIIFPRCTGKTLDQYPALFEWRDIYEKLKANGIIKVEDRLAKMVDLINSTPGA